MKAMELAKSQKGSCRKIPIALKMAGTGILSVTVITSAMR